jgi:excisionase family DNA binding protein
MARSARPIGGPDPGASDDAVAPPVRLWRPRPRPDLPDLAEAAEQLQVCERTVRRAIDAGVLRAARVRGTRAERGCWRIHRDDLARWLYEEPSS